MVFWLSAFVAARVFLFVLGARRLGDPVAVTAGILAALFAASYLPFSTLPLFFVVFAAVEIVGIREVAARIKHRAPSLPTLAVAGIFLVALGFWTWALADLDGLNSSQDGIAHSLFLMRLAQGGHALLAHNPVSLSEWFGDDQFRFYPTGSHALVVAFEWPFLKFGWIYAAALIKAWEIAVSAGVVLLAYAVGSRLYPRKPLIALMAALLAMTYYRYPIWAVDSGGFSRQLALWIAFAAAFSVLARGPVKGRWYFLIPPVAFLLHPSAFVLAMAVLVWIALPERQAREWVFRSLGLCLGMAVLYWLMRATGSDDHMAAFTPVRAMEWDPVRRNIEDFFKAAAGDPGEISSLTVREVLFHIGFCLPLFCLKSLSPRQRWFPHFLWACLLSLLLFSFVPHRLAMLSAQLLYGDGARAAEVFALATWMLWCFSLAEISDRLGRGGKWVSTAALILLGLWAAYDTVAGMRFTRDHIRRYSAVYHAPRHSESAALMEWVRRNTSRDAFFVGEHRLLDSLESRTGRKSLFVFHECPHGLRGNSCERRWHLYQTVIGASEDCKTLPPISQPMYWVSLSSETSHGKCHFFGEPQTVGIYTVREIKRK